MSNHFSSESLPSGNELKEPKENIIENNRRQYEKLWTKKWNELETIQLDTLRCDTLIYTEKHKPPLFKIIHSKSEPKKRKNDVNAKFPPVFSISVKKSKLVLEQENADQ